MPGVHMPIAAPEKLLEDQPDYVLLVAWNYSDEVMRQQAEYLRARRPVHRARSRRRRSCERRSTYASGRRWATLDARARVPELRRARARSSFHEQRDIPVHSVRLVETREEALGFPRGDAAARLLRRLRVHHQHRLRPVAAGLLASPTRRPRASRRRSTRSRATLAGALGRRATTCAASSVLEIGYGKGEFLVDMIEPGAGRGGRHRPELIDGRARRRRSPTGSRSSTTTTPRRTRT